MFDPTPLASQEALFDLGCWLRQRDYRHVCSTPATHQRYLQRRAGRVAETAADAFGWNLPFTPDLLPAALLERLAAEGLATAQGAFWKSGVRYSTLDGCGATGLFCHSAFPTVDEDAVFFGPDSHRFAAAIRRAARDARFSARPGLRAVELCAGAGPGAWTIAQCLRQHPPADLLLTDLNPKALACATVNARLAQVAHALPAAASNAPPARAGMAARAAVKSPVLRFTQADLFGDAPGRFDLIVANPPYLLDAARRTYRHGGEALGTDLALRIARTSLPRLAPGGCLVLYTGAPIVRGQDILRRALSPLLDGSDLRHEYTEIDPDVFGEELEQPGYVQVDRIAAVSLTLFSPGA